ncbi:hypothetical protein BH11CYA1_BH11CYA1_10710 [soil metagenome]
MLTLKSCFRFCYVTLLLSSFSLVLQSCSANNGEGPITKADTEAVKEGIRGADETPVVDLQAPPQTFSFESHKFTIHAEAPLKLQMQTRRNSRTYAFLGPERPNLGQSVFSIIVINGGAAEHVPNKVEMMDGMLHPFRQRLTGYKESLFTLDLANGKSESGSEFSGTLSDGSKLHGFVVVIPVKDGLYTLTTTDREEQYGQGIAKLKNLAKTIKIEN